MYLQIPGILFWKGENILKTKNNIIEQVYFLGIFLVILGHSHPIGTEYPQWINTFIYRFHMPLFFLISGVLIFYSTRLKKEGMKRWFLENCIKILIPYVVWSLIGFLPKYALQSYMTDKVDLSILYIVKSLWFPRDGVWGHFWFMPVLLILELAGGCIYFLINRYRYKTKTTALCLLTGFLCISLFLHINPIRIKFLALYDVSKQMIFFALGMLAGYIMENYEWQDFGRKIRKYKNVLEGISIIAAATMIISTQNSVIKELLITVLLIIAFTVLASYLPLKIVKIFSPYRFSLYLLGWPFQAVMEVVVNKTFHMPWIVVYACMFFIGAAAPVIIVKLYKKTAGIQCKFLNYMLGIA